MTEATLQIIQGINCLVALEREAWRIEIDSISIFAQCSQYISKFYQIELRQINFVTTPQLVGKINCL